MISSSPHVPGPRGLTARRWRAVACVTAVALGAASCSSLPTYTEPKVLESFSPAQPEAQSFAPGPDRAPDLLLHDFFSASSQPAQAYQAARAFLADDDAIQRWPSGNDIIVVDQLDFSTKPGATDSAQEFAVKGNIIGRLDRSGAFRPDSQRFDASVRMEKNRDGQWRITSVPPEVIIDRTELRNHYEPQRLFYLDANESALVGDRRWVFSGQKNIDDVLMGLLAHGPSQRIAPAVSYHLPEDAVYMGSEGGVYRFSGFSSLNREQRMHFGAQVVWTLAENSIPGPYEIELDGAPLAEGRERLTTDDFADFNPTSAATSTAPLYALTSQGQVMKVAANAAERVDGPLAAVGPVERADITAAGAAAVVRRAGDRDELLLGTLSGGPFSSGLKARKISRPSMEDNAQAAWAVVDGHEVVRVVRSSSSGEVVHSTVSLADVEEDLGLGAAGDDSSPSGRQPSSPGQKSSRVIEEVRLSCSGARLAMLVSGHVYVGVVKRTESGARSVVNVIELAPQLAGQATALAWNADGSLLVGTSVPESPVFRVEDDGSETRNLNSVSVSPPVEAIASTPGTLYLTDAQALRQLSVDPSNEGSFWREVQGLQGTKATPLVVH